MVNLRRIRIAKGFTLQQLAKHIGVKYNTICQWEIGTREPEISYVKKLANFFNVTTDFILDCDNNIEEFKNDDLFYRLLKKLSRLDEEQLSLVSEFIESLNPVKKKTDND